VQAHHYSARELVRRFARRHRAAVIVGVAALLALGVLGGVGLRRIVTERRHAEAERARAEAARGRAETQQVAAEALVEFILGDLRGRLERAGRLDALEGAARAVLGYQDHLPPAEDEAAWIRRSKAATLAGSVARATGDFGAAEDAYRRGLRAAESATGAGADEARCQADLGLGDARKGRGDLDAAVAAYEACAAIAVRAEGAAFRDLLVESRIHLADVARIRGDLAASRRLLEESLPVAEARVREAGVGAEVSRVLLVLRFDLWKTLDLSGEVRLEGDEARAALALARARAEARRDDLDAQHLRAVAGMQAGVASENAGDLAAAERAYREALAEHRAIAAHDPSNTEWQRSVGVAADRLGNLAMTRGDFKASLEWFRASDASSMQLAAIEPKNPEWQRDLSVSALAIGDVLVKLGRLDEARASTKRAIDLLEQLVSRGPDAGRAEKDLGVTLGHLGQLELAARDLPAASAALERSVVILGQLLRGVDTPQARLELAAATLLLAEAERGPKARRHVEEALALLEPLRPTASTSPELAELIKEADRARARAAASSGGDQE
jgi:tetratricopeptide (TPR) repeat protein